jgi:hypothetical protein
MQAESKGGTRSMRFMTSLFVAAALACTASCGPELNEEPSRGELVYSDDFKDIYQLDRRIEVVARDPMYGKSGCGYLTDRAYEDLERTIAALDPSKDYVVDPERCSTSVMVYIEGFEHSPFECVWLCCHPELVRVALVYLAVISNLSSQEPVIDDVPYVALEPDRPCE